MADGDVARQVLDGAGGHHVGNQAKALVQTHLATIVNGDAGTLLATMLQ
jgi:hypothetical protein